MNEIGDVTNSFGRKINMNEYGGITHLIECLPNMH